MTLEELYANMGGNYEHAKQIMKMDKLIDKYVRKLKNSDIKARLASAFETMDAAQLFESAHAMKGVCGNLGLDSLADAAEKITEEFRPGGERKYSDDEVKGFIAEVDELYSKTIEGIKRYEAEQ